LENPNQEPVNKNVELYTEFFLGKNFLKPSLKCKREKKQSRRNAYAVTSATKRSIACWSLSGRSSLININLSIGRTFPPFFFANPAISTDSITGDEAVPEVPEACCVGESNGGSRFSGSLAVNLKM
jgi:hypothetical protein